MIGEKAADEWVARMAYLKPPGWERVETGSSRNVDWLVVTQEGGVLRSFGRIMSRQGGKGREEGGRERVSQGEKRRREKDCKTGMCKLEVDDDSLSVGVVPSKREGWMLLDTFDFLVLTPTRPSTPTLSSLFWVLLLLDSTTVEQ